MSDGSMTTTERLFLASVIGILLAPKLAALGFPKDVQDKAIGLIATGIPAVYHFAMKYAGLYLRYFMRERHIPLPEDLEPHPTQPARPAQERS
ncbi:MAG: hypothetical protein KGL39_15360 [Patescibacteria group bacterium]|nr:hypothetical protein [Patescibacteria group bacterium]